MSKLAILGGSPVRSIPFPERKTMGEEEKRAACRVLDSDVLSGFLGAGGKAFNGGPEVLNFEKKWADRYGFKHAISVNSWTAGLTTMIGAVGIAPGDEVICPPYTMSATATSVLFYGGIPVFADIDPTTYGLDPKSVEKCITERTKAILVVHLFGGPADMDPLLAIAKKHGLKIIEDAAQAPGVLYKGKAVGAIGDIGGFSLNYHKHIHAGEGGLIVTQDDELAARCRMIRNHGENALDSYAFSGLDNLIGGNFRFTELQAAIAAEQFEKLSGILSRRQSLASRLSDRLRGIPGLVLPQLLPQSTHAFYMFPIRYLEEKMSGVTRSTFLKAVAAELPEPKGWETTPFGEAYVKPLYLNPIYQKQIAIGKEGFPFNYTGKKYNYSKGICPVTERLYEKEMLYSPLVREPLSDADIDDFGNAIEKVSKHLEELAASDINRATTGIFFDAVKATNRTIRT